MADGWAAVAALFAGGSLLEACGAAFGLVYVILAVRESRWCWLYAFASTALYFGVFAQARLYMQAGLQLYFLAVAAYGWVAWKGDKGNRPVVLGRQGTNVAALAGLWVLAEGSARLLAVETHSAAPLLDALSTWASVYATGLQARKYRENWLWWIVIDLLIAGLCLRQGLYLTTLLYGVFVGLAVLGWRSWRPIQAAA